MLTSLAIVIITSLFMFYVFDRIKLHGLLGLILTGIILGPFVFNIIDTKLLSFSSEFKMLALILILIRAGLGLRRSELNKVKIYALKTGLIPLFIEVIVVAVASFYILGLPPLVSIMFGFIMAPVSPAIIIPHMLDIKEKNSNKSSKIPTLLIATTSIDNVVAMMAFGIMLGIVSGKHDSVAEILFKIPISIILGVVMGLVTGYVLVKIFEKYDIRDTRKALIFLFLSVLIHETEKVLPISSLLVIVTTGFFILEKNENIAHRLSSKFNKIWIFAEILLFVIIGAQLNIGALGDVAFKGLFIIIVGLLGRSIGVLISLSGSELKFKERLFCAASYLPKATVQAAIASIPFAMGIAGGGVILAIAVLSIIITTPLGIIIPKMVLRFK